MQQNIRYIASSLKFLWYGSMEWNMEENFNMEWNMEENFWIGMEYGMEDFWYGMEENCQYGIWKNRFPFVSIPCPACMTVGIIDQ